MAIDDLAYDSGPAGFPDALVAIVFRFGFVLDLRTMFVPGIMKPTLHVMLMGNGTSDVMRMRKAGQRSAADDLASRRARAVKYRVRKKQRMVAVDG